MKQRVSIVKCDDYDNDKLKESISKSIKLLGGIGRYIRKGSRVLLKPNLLSAKKPVDAVTTHPEFVRAVIAVVKEAGGIVSLGDSPSGLISNSKMKRIYRVTGMEEVCRETGTRIVSFEDDPVVYNNENGRVYKNFTMSGKLKEYDVIISLPKMKTHGLTLLTGAVKNNYGFIPGLRKAELHIILNESGLFSEMLLDVGETIRPALIITDAVVSMEGAGPGGGDPRNTGLIISGTNASVLDYIMARIMGYTNPLKVPTIKAAVERGLLMPERIEVLGIELKEAIEKDFKKISLIKLDLVPRFLKDFAKNLLSPKPIIIKSKCLKCGECITICPAKTIIRDSRQYPLIKYKDCIRCFCCMETCPHASIKTGTVIVLFNSKPSRFSKK